MPTTSARPTKIDLDTTTPTPTMKPLLERELPSLIALRRELHAHPELSFHEKRTSEVVLRELKAIGIETKSGFCKDHGGTGVLGYLPASTSDGNKLPAVGLRADMDALPIVENTQKPYSSCNPGVMHACGHDGHTTMLVGAARVLSKINRPRPVLFCFQPAEEGGGGADRMCKEGAIGGAKKGGLGNPVEKMFGLHGWPQLPLGSVATKSGPLLASVDDFIVTIRGTQSHGAYPQLGRDPVVASAHIITALQTIASRNIGPLESVVVTVAAINAGTANNIIPEEVRFIGTVRTLKASIKTLARERFFAIVESTAASLGCKAEIEWHDGYPVTSNDAKVTDEFFAVAQRVLNSPTITDMDGMVPAAGSKPSPILRLDQPTMGGEDFAYYGHHVPTCFFFLGLKPNGATNVPTLHQAEFDFNDDALGLGIEIMASLALA
jgi:amidohydrolase